jgi:sorting nexin-25
MEFMDRRHRSLLVQFWLTVESFKNPLEAIDSASSDDEDEPIQDTSTPATVKEDISMINDLYFSHASPHPTLASISNKHVDIIRAFAQNETSPSHAAQRKVRRSVMLAQRQVERDMEQDFEEFERSELWFRAIGDTDFASKKAAHNGHSSVGENVSSSNPMFPHNPSRPDAGHLRQPVSPGTGLSPIMQRTASSGSHRSTNSTSFSPNPLHRAPPTNIEVLMSPVSDPDSEPSRAPLFDDPEDHLQRQEEKRMEAIQAALTDIMALEQEQSDKLTNGGKAATATSVRPSKPSHTTDNGKRRAVFDDDDDDDLDVDEDVEDGGPDDSNNNHGSFQLAAPGDLQLSYEIARLGDNIANLQAQDAMLDTLIKKAELTGDTQELKLLLRSKSSMNRDLRELKFQKLQYEQQESANRLFSDRTKVSIVNSTVGDEEGKSVVRYLIEVQQLAPDGSFASGWVVARRYNEFFNLHNKLRERYSLVKNLDFPGKRLVTSLSGSFLDTRRVALERYLQVIFAFCILLCVH